MDERTIRREMQRRREHAQRVPDHVQDGRTLPQQIEGDHAYRDEPPTPAPPPVQVGDYLTEMAGSSHSRTWEVKEIADGRVYVELVGKAVGYEHTYNYEGKVWELDEVRERLEMSDVNKGALHFG